MQPEEKLTIEQLQKKVDNWIRKIGVRYFNELTNMALLTEEVGELARIIARKYGEQSFKNDEEKIDISEEIADVLFVLVCIANQTGVDLNEAIINSFKKKSKRDNSRHKNNYKLL